MPDRLERLLQQFRVALGIFRTFVAPVIQDRGLRRLQEPAHLLADDAADELLELVRTHGYRRLPLCHHRSPSSRNRVADRRGFDKEADGIIQGETAALLASTRFASTVDAWLLAATDALGAAGALGLLRGRGISPLAVSGIVSRSALGRREVEASTKIPCLAAAELEEGALNPKLLAAAPPSDLKVLSGEQPAIMLR